MNELNINYPCWYSIDCKKPVLPNPFRWQSKTNWFANDLFIIHSQSKTKHATFTCRWKDHNRFIHRISLNYRIYSILWEYELNSTCNSSISIHYIILSSILQIEMDFVCFGLGSQEQYDQLEQVDKKHQRRNK